MSVVIQGRYYNTSNSETVDKNYLSLCGLRFPLARGRTLIEEEQSYTRRNEKVIQDMKNRFEKEINVNKKTLDEIQKEVDLREDIAFFISHICVPHERTSKFKEDAGSKKISNSNEPIWPLILAKDYAIINGRVYPLKPASEPVFVNLDNKNYTLDRGEMKVEDAESKFINILTQRIRIQAMNDSVKVKEIAEKAKALDEKILSLETALKISRYPHCYEYGDIGYDTSIRCVYWLIPPHHNRSSGRSYSEGQSAAVLPLANGQLGTAGSFAERNDRNSPFAIFSYSLCLGFGLNGNSLEDKMLYLKTFANVVSTNGALHE